jgi:hypothetical protein
VQSNIQIHIRRLHRRTKSKKFCPYHTTRLRSRQRQRSKSTKVSRHAYIHTYIHIKAHLFDTASPKIGQPCLVSSRRVSSRLTSPFDSAATSPETNVPAHASPNSPCQPSRSLAPYRDPSLVLGSRIASGANEPVRHGMTEPEMETKTHSYSFFFASGNPEPTPSGPGIFLTIERVALHCVCVTALLCYVASS